jgi:hypothetical protein
MKSKIFISLVVFLSCTCYAQQNTFNKEVELQKVVERGNKVEETSPNIIKLIYKLGETRAFNLNQKQNVVEQTKGINTTIINIWEIDTTLYSNRFSFWQRVELQNGNFLAPFIDDLNRNGRPEIYGFHHSDYPNGGPVEIYEMNLQRKYSPLYAYSDSGVYWVKGMGEIHGTGEKEIYMGHVEFWNGVVYKSDSVGVLPTTFDFVFYHNANQINDMTFGDFNNNGITDCVFIDNPLLIIAEYYDSINNFQTVFQIPDEFEASGFIVGDFDMDGQTELVYATGQGEIHIIEHRDANVYSENWQGTFPTFNAYMKTSTNDIDGNGKSEFWIGGQDFENGITRFQAYESVSNNNYQEVAAIELRYINSFYANQIMSKDMDNDGKDELIISIGQVILILKFNGLPYTHSYKIFYAKVNELSEPTAIFEPVNLYHLNSDSLNDILLPFDKSIGNQPDNFSYILVQNDLSGIFDLQDDDVLTDYSLSSYPVPFNSTSVISFAIKKQELVKIKIFNSLGKEITTLLEEEISPGNHKINWEAQDQFGNPLSSGVYLICLQTKSGIKTTKTILLK